MNPVELRRKDTKWNIAQNPTTITIKRTEKIRAGGAIDEVELPVGPFTVRIFSSKTAFPKTVTTLAGEKHVDQHYGLLADYEADIQAGTNVKDEFEVNGMKFIVIAVHPQSINGQIVSYQCELEKVG
ncbi:MAG TPA: hypothetical protein DEO65_04430 [Bacillus bacterium]|uniref:hypothetical protein n=1 Tax=Siminovitchia fordii TaxID=254759 RepID=UPI00037103CE|nr:hypothetical protein [Siminovitchia fordii]HBZ09122.1 hypothetical protein [Bacillus sp. (in: firmicutes)]